MADDRKYVICFDEGSYLSFWGGCRRSHKGFDTEWTDDIKKAYQFRYSQALAVLNVFAQFGDASLYSITVYENSATDDDLIAQYVKVLRSISPEYLSFLLERVKKYECVSAPSEEVSGDA